MGDSRTDPTEPPVDLLTAVRDWLWRHSSQPNGNPWDSDPEHLERAAQNLLDDLGHLFTDTDTDPRPAISTPPARTWRAHPARWGR